MASPTDPPHQISYEDVCKHAGRLFLESRNDIERLTGMLLDLQAKLTQEQLDHSKTKAELAQAQQLQNILSNPKQ